MTWLNIFTSPAGPHLSPKGVPMFPEGQCLAHRAPDPTACQASRTFCCLESMQELAPGPREAISQAEAPPACHDCWLQMSPSLSPTSQQARVNIAWLVRDAMQGLEGTVVPRQHSVRRRTGVCHLLW